VYGYCSKPSCWNNNVTNCTSVPNCAWNSQYSYCYEQGCWNYYDSASCGNTSDTLNCDWQTYGYCQKLGCYDYSNQSSCEVSPACEWYSYGWCSKLGCDSFKTQTDCESHAKDKKCVWDSSYSYCYEKGCWNYNNQSSCGAIPGCQWNSQWNYCYEESCWNYYNSSACTNSTIHPTLSCDWESPQYCYQVGCWNLNTNASCMNITDSLNCTWKTSGWCQSMNVSGTNCWSYFTNDTCVAQSGCSWTQSSWCEEIGPWTYNTNSTCSAAGFNWTSSGGSCSDPTTIQCWNYDYNQTGCNLMNSTCRWSNPYCVKRGCWDYSTNDACSAAPLEQNCRWTSSSGSGWCEELGCWNFWNNQTACNQYNTTMNCDWRTYGWCESGCWNYSSAETCNAKSRCYWNSDYNWCNDKGCWNYNTNTTCLNSTLHSDLNCTWDTTWGYGYCKKSVECWNINNNATCINAGCSWEINGTGGGWCMEKGCWNYRGSSQCSSNNCTWRSQSYCEKRNCWMFNTSDTCSAANVTWNLSCTWNNGYCSEYYVALGSSCFAYNNDSAGCKNTGYCWWNKNGTCEEPSTTWKNEFEDKKENPGCWIFDNAQAKCNVTNGCSWINSSLSCVGLETAGIQCGNITDASLCSKIPILSSCCKWSNNTCQPDSVNTKCFDNIKPPPEGATFCEDYNSYSDQALCQQIAGDPWYMPCRWTNMSTSDTSDDRCTFRSQEKFGNSTKDLKKITNKKDCEFAGGTWNQEYYCEGNNSVPYGWCEIRTGAARKSCNAACWACEYQNNGTRWSNAAAATAACVGSKLGYCNWRNDTNAPNGFGYCEMSADMKTGTGDCNTDCKACEKKTNPGTACNASAASCKWVVDKANTTTKGGWCYPQTEKACSEDCFRCYDEVSCINYGKGTKGSCKWDAETKICMPTNFDKEICFDGIDNDADSKIDCSDADCFSDTFCGAAIMSNCWKYDTQTKCVNNGTADNCIWITDPWTSKSWCGRKGENCFLWDGNQTGCNNQTNVCQWFTDPKGGFCDLNETKVQTCYKLTTEGPCKANSDCKWTLNPATKSGSCEFKLMKCEGLTQTVCNTTCAWEVDPIDKSAGKCVAKCMGSNYQNEGVCSGDTNCKWMSGFCDPSDQLGMKMEDCWKLNNQTSCANAAGCDWYIGRLDMGRSCDLNMTLERDTCAKKYNSTTCTAESLCKWNSNPGGTGFCDMKIHGCGLYTTSAACVADAQSYGGCVWKNVTMSSGGGGGYGGFTETGRCEPKCFNTTLPQEQCIGQCAPAGSGGGKCEPKMAKMMFNGMDNAPPTPLGGDDCSETGVAAEQDICGFGVKDSSDNYAFGIMVRSLENAAMCKGEDVKLENSFSSSYSVGSGTNTTKFYWYLDTDGSTTGGCWMHNNESAVGFEFFFKYIAEWSSGALKETRTAYRCDGGEWVISDIKLSTWQSLMCGEIGGGMISVDKKSLNKFSDLYKPEQKMRVFVATGNKTTSETNPTTSKRFVDIVGPGYYTKGAMDFSFEDCMITGVDKDGDGMNSENDPDCEMFQKFGFIRYEDCFESGVDEDGDNMTDCYDTDCKFAPNCAGKGVNAAGYSDTTAPTLKFSDVSEFPDAAIIKYDTSEPANGSVTFYYNSSTCSDVNSSGLNRLIKDPALLDSDTWNNFKNWHDASIDNFATNPQRLGYNLTNGTTYYYKIRVCDSSGNCGTSACLNFTTAASSSKKDCPDCEFTLKFTMHGANDIKIDFGSGYQSFSGSTSGCDGGTGFKSNYSQSGTANVKIEGDDSSITFGNASLVGVTGTVNLTEGSATVSGYSVGYVGMPSETFDDLAGKMRPESCTLEVPKGTNGNCDKLWHCDENVANCVDVTADATLLSSTSTICTWKVSCDFSTYRANTPTSSGDNPSSVSGGGGGAGGGSTTSKVKVKLSKGKDDITIPSISSGKFANVTINDTEDMAVRRIQIFVKNSVNNIQIIITKLDGKPASVIHEVSGRVYHYFEIDKTNITEGDMNKTKISFKVDKIWISNNKIDEATIALNRYTERWNKLSTVKTGEDSDYIYFDAEAEGFSTFAITGEEKTTTGEKPSEETTPSGTQEEISESIEKVVGENKMILIIASIAAVLLISIIILWRKSIKKRKAKD